MSSMHHFGMESLIEEEQVFNGFLAYLLNNSKPIVGYYGIPYLLSNCGYVDFIMRPHKEEDKFAVSAMDVHMSGHTKWDVVISEIDVQPKNADLLTRKVAVSRATDGGGIAVVNLVNADVLPSFLPGERIVAQMVGYPEEIHYYKDEDEYEERQGEDFQDNKLILADGCVFASGLFHNRGVRRGDEERLEPIDEMDDYCLIRGTVKAVHPGLVRLADEDIYSFLDVVISTEFGDLQIAHTREQVAEEERNNICVGATVYGLFSLTGDVAIGKYKESFVKDEEHTLSLLRYSLTKGDVERIRYLLAEDAEYISEASGQTHTGRDAILERLRYVRENNTHRDIKAHKATLLEPTEDAPDLTYQAGKRCLLLLYGTENVEEAAILFIEEDEAGNVVRLYVSDDRRYRFLADAEGDTDAEAEEKTLRDEMADEEEESEEEDGEKVWEELLEDHEGDLFAIETLGWQIVSFDASFQKEVFEKYLATENLTQEEALELLSSEEKNECVSEMRTLGVDAVEGELVFHDLCGETNMEIMDLLERLGWKCDFDGESWKFETTGVYYIEM